jgi:protease secretion system membrane fusion protein
MNVSDITQLPRGALATRPVAPVELAAHANAGRAARIGLWTLLLGLGGFVAWAAWAPLDEGVPSTGMVAIDTKRKSIQHLSGGIVRKVLVREGQAVKEGDKLLELDDAVARANHESLRQRYLGLRAVQGRLQAEQSAAASIEFHPDLLAAAQTDPLIESQLQNEQQLWQSRRGALQAELQAIDANISGQAGLLQSYKDMLEHRRQGLASLQEELKQTRELVAEGYAPRNRQLELERAAADASGAVAQLLGNLQQARSTIAELRQRALALQQGAQQEIETQLADVNRNVLADAEALEAAKAELERTRILSPASGQVVGLAVQTVGAVIQPGQMRMDVVPEGEPLLLEVKVAPHLIDRVKAGLKTDVRFSAFAHTPQLVVEGEVQSVSADLLSEPLPTGGATAFYLARVALTVQGLQALGGRRLQPGMPVEVVIKTGERSVLTYLLSPLTKRLAAAMKEE